MKQKRLTLLAGNEYIDDEKWYWNIPLHISRSGKIWDTGVKARRNHAYYLKHRERRKQQVKDWSRDNKESVVEYKRKYYAANQEEVTQRAIEWNRAHPDRRREHNAKWRDENPEEYRQMLARSNKKQKAKRKGMGFQPLNEMFEGSQGHHVNNDQVIYMPASIHQGVRHNLRTGEGMAEINALAFQYLFKHT
jgi:hypothetical protein